MTLKARLAAAIAVVIGMVTIYLIQQTWVISSAKGKKEKAIENIPSTVFYKTDSSRYTILSANKPVMFVYFNSMCDLCHLQTADIKKHLKPLRDVDIYFVSSEPLSIISSFGAEQDLLTEKNIMFLKVATEEVAEIFGSEGTPLIILYDKGGKLIERYRGGVDISQLLLLLKGSS